MPVMPLRIYPSESIASSKDVITQAPHHRNNIMRLYLDNAATSFPKPEAVYSAVDNYQRRIGMAIGRSTSRSGLEVGRMVQRCRQLAAELLSAESPDRIVITFNTTDGLNLAIHGLCRPGDHVVASQLEHNSVLRPLRWLKDHRGIEVTILNPNPDGCIDPIAVRNQFRPNTRLVAVQHASNVTDLIQPVESICQIARQAGIFSVVDAAQSAGHRDINLRNLCADLLVCPGHKGLLGPLGTGLVYVRPGIESALECYRLGGTGTQSEDDRQPESMPDRYEAGNHNAPGLAGLLAALEYLRERTVQDIQQSEENLTKQLVSGLRSLRGITVYGHTDGVSRSGVVSFNVDGYTPQEVSGILDESFNIQTRAGLHCSPGAHRFLGTFDRGGTVRMSVGAFTSCDDIESAISAVRQIAG